MQLFKHQQETLDRSPKITGLWWECGLGKTLTAIRLVEAQPVTEALVVCPKSLKENWKRELDVWATRDIDWKIVTKEELRRDHLALALENRKGVIVDESHFFHGHKSKMHKALVKYLQLTRPKCLYLLTATPMLSTPYNVYAISALLGRAENWMEFTREFFFQMKMGRRTIWQPRKDKDAELQRLLRSYGETRSAAECLDLPGQIFQREDFALNPAQRKGLKEINDDPTVTTPIVKWSKVHQLCGGTLKVPGTVEINYFNSDKTKRTVELAQEHKKLVVVCRYNAELELLSDVLKSKSIQNFILNGQTKNRQGLIDEFIQSERAVLLVNAAVSEGYNLPGVNVMVFYSLSFSLKDRVQMLGRIYGNKRGVEGQPSIYIDLVTKGTIDEDVWRTIQRKEDFQVELYNSPEL